MTYIEAVALLEKGERVYRDYYDARGVAVRVELIIDENHHYSPPVRHLRIETTRKDEIWHAEPVVEDVLASWERLAPAWER